MPKMKLSSRNWLDQVRFVMKIRDKNDMIDRIGLVYAKTKT